MYMSFDKAEILARLQNGDTVDEIADELAGAINAAQAEYKELQEQESKKAEAEKIRILNAKREAVDNMLDALCDYYMAAGCEDFIADVQKLNTDKLIELLDGSIEMAKRLEKLKGLQFPMLHEAATINPKVHKIVVDEDNADEVIGIFLKQFGL